MAFEISYIYEVRDKFSRPLAKFNSLSKKAKLNTDKLARSSKQLSRNMKDIREKTQATSAAIALIGAAAIRTAVSFETSMNKLQSVTLASSNEIDSMREKAKQLGITTQFSASQAAQGMTFLAMAGLDTNRILGAIDGTLQLAAASGLDMATAADIATNVLTSMGLEVRDLTRVNDVLSLSQARANTNVYELAEAMRPVAATANNLGISLEELTAVLGTMANAGEKGSIAGTLFRNMLTRTAGAGEKQRKIYKALGINLSEFVDKTGQIKNFTGFIAALEKTKEQGKLTVPVLQALFGERGFRAAQVIVGQGSKSLADFNTILADAGGTAEKMTKIQMQGLPGRLKEIRSAVEGLSIAFVEAGIGEELIRIIEGLTKFVRKMSDTNPRLMKFIGAVGALAVVITPLLMLLGGLAAAIAVIGSPIALTVAGIGLLIAVMVTFGDKITEFGENLGGRIFEIVQYIKSLFDEASRFKGVAKLLGLMNPIGIIAGGVAATNAQANAAAGGTMGVNGQINLNAPPGVVQGASMDITGVPGNLGFNMAGAQ